jgi:electron transfer flavoprotein beta subunit
MIRCIVLLSIGCNPVSGRPRLPPLEAAAISMALRAGLRPHLLHAGPAAAACCLHRGLGLGAAGLEILAIGPEDDPLPALLDHLTAAAPGLLLAGGRAETGEGSGMLPLRLAESLGRPVITDCADLQHGGPEHWLVRAARRGGARQVLGVTTSAVLSVGAAARMAPLGGRASVDRVTVTPASAPRDPRHDAALQRVRPVPRPIGAVAAAPAARSGAGRVDDPVQAATAIFDLLRSAGLV